MIGASVIVLGWHGMSDPAPETERGLPQPPRFTVDEARGGEIVLLKGWERAVFVFGLSPAVILALILCLAAWR
jgi:hypothetical protein